MVQLGNLTAEERIPADLRLQVLSVGVAYGNQSAVVEDVMTDLIPLPITALTADSPIRDFLLRVVAEADQLREAANLLGDDLRRSVGADKLPWDKGFRLGDSLIHEYDPVVRRMLAGLQREPGRTDDAEAAWCSAARRLALRIVEPVLEAAPPEAFLGRQDDRNVHRLSLAEAKFRRRVNDILGPSAGMADIPATIAGA
jgi:CRISPR system Cascade subunit CasA